MSKCQRWTCARIEDNVSAAHARDDLLPHVAVSHPCGGVLDTHNLLQLQSPASNACCLESSVSSQRAPCTDRNNTLWLNSFILCGVSTVLLNASFTQRYSSELGSTTACLRHTEVIATHGCTLCRSEVIALHTHLHVLEATRILSPCWRHL